MRLHLRVLALLSTTLVLFAGVAPGLERCGDHRAMASGTMAGHTMEMPVETPAVAWTASHPDTGTHTVCCLFMSTCSSQGYLGGGTLSARVADNHAPAAGALARALASVVSPPESPPPRA